MFRKRRREQPDIDTQLIEIYEDLANNDSDVRLKAAHLLLSKLAPKNEPSLEQLNKCLKRLIRGLCSGRKSARLGFSVALTELLAQHAQLDETASEAPSLTISGVIQNLQDLTRTTGATSGQEERDYCFGRLFGAEALIKSKTIFDSRLSIETWMELTDLIIELAKRKSWLREECGWVLFDSIQILKHVHAGQQFVQIILDKVHAADMIRTPEGVAIWVACQQIYSDLKFPKHVFHHHDPLHRKEKSALCRILRESSAVQDAKDFREGGFPGKLQKGSWSSKLHFAWDVVLNSVLQEQGKRVTFVDIWREAVDEGLFAASSSNERKFWGFLLVQRHIVNVPTEVIPSLLQQNFSRCLVNQLASKDRYLHTIAEETLRPILTRASANSRSASAIITALVDISPAFDKLSKTKSLEKLLADADLDTLETVVPTLTKSMTASGNETDSEKRNTYCRTIADLLISIVRTNTFPRGKEPELDRYRNIIAGILKCFAQQAYATHENSSDALREMFKSRIMSCLTHTITKDVTDPSILPNSVLRTVHKFPDALPSADGDVLNTIKQGWTTLDKIVDKEQSAGGRERDMLGALKLLYIFSLLQVYDGDTDAISILDELKSCYKSFRRDGRGGDLIVEVLLSFVSKPPLLFRRLAPQVLSAWTGAVDEQGLLSMVHVLEAKENLGGQESIFDTNDGGSDVEIDDISDIEADNRARTPDPEVDGDNERGAEDEAELAAFDAKLAQALGTRRADDDLKIEDEESSDDDMNDDQMEALDSHLITIFKHRKEAQNKKKDKKDAKETMVAFKCRVLELLETFLKQETASARALIVVVPLVYLVRSTRSKQLSEKACRVIKTFTKLYKLSFTGHVTDSEALKLGRLLLEDAHRLATEGGSNAYGLACSRSSLLAAKVILNNHGTNEEVQTRYDTTYELYKSGDPKCKIRSEFFTDYNNWKTQARRSHSSNGA